MAYIFLLALAVLVVGVVVSTIHDIHVDGYGRSQPPRSHNPDLFDPASRLRH